MKNLDDLIASLERRDEEEIKEVHEASNNLRELADLFDQLVKEEISREEIERIIGKMIILVIKLDGII